MSTHFSDVIEKLKVAGEIESFLENVREKTAQILEEHGQQFPDNVAVGLNEEEDGLKLYCEEDEINPLLGVVVLQVAEKEVAKLGGFAKVKTAIPVLDSDKSSSSKIGTIIFYTLNGLLFLGSVAWVFAAFNSSDFRQWYSSELLDVSSVFASLAFSVLIPAVLLATVLVFFMRRNSEDVKVTVTDAFWKFELPVLIILFFIRETALIMPMTDGLRVFIAILSWIVVADIFVHRFKLVPRTFLPSLAAYTSTTVSFSVISYWIFAGLIPMAIVIGSELEFDFIGEIFETLLYEPFLLFFLAFYLILGLVPYILTYLLSKRVLLRLGQYKDIINSRWQHLGVTLQVGAPITLVILLFILSRSPGIGEYAEPLILAAQSDNTYNSLQLRALPLLEDKAEIEKRLENEVNKYEQYLFRSTEFDDGDFADNYFSIVYFPFIDSDNYKSNNSNNRQTLLRGYEKVFGEAYSSRRDNMIELKQVQLRSRDVLVNTLDSEYVANVTVTDAYTTFVTRDQEVVLEFSLPEHAVITDLKLGSALQYQGQIAPRGAAERVYNEQVWRNVDPALLEQVGPRQYRLRVYPIPASTNRAAQTRREEVEGETQRVQFSYTALRDTEGIPLPVFSQQYNLLTSETEYSYNLNGQPVAVDDDSSHIAEPNSLNELCASGVESVSSASYGNNYSVKIGTNGESATCSGLTGSNLNLSGQSITFYLDTSFDTDKSHVSTILDQMRALPDELFSRNNVALMYFNDLQSELVTINSAEDIPRVDDIVFFGGTQLWDLVKNAKSDISVFITGDVPQEASAAGNNQTFRVNGHLAFVHYGETIPIYRNSVLNQIKSQSFKVYDDVDSVFRTISFWSDSNPDKSLAVGEYWSILKSAPATTSTSSQAHTLSTKETKDLRLVALRGELLVLNQEGRYSQESLHQTAKINGIVTPLSSYIALVNNQQQQRLNELSNQEDRFSSEMRFRVSQPQPPNPFSGSSVGGMLMVQSTGLEGSDMMAPTPDSLVFDSPRSVSSPSSAIQNPLSGNSGSAKLPLILFFGVVGLAVAGSVYAVIRHRRQDGADD